MGTLVCRVELNKETGVTITVENADDGITQTAVLDGTAITFTCAGSDTSTITQKCDSVAIECKDFSVMADTVKVESTKDTEHKSSGKMTVKSTQDMSLDSTGKLDAKAAMDFTAEGLSFTAKGTTDAKIEGLNAELKGTAKAVVKGGMVELSGDAMADVKGPMIKVAASGILDLNGSMTKIGGGMVKLG
jgi:hypothetical protein